MIFQIRLVTRIWIELNKEPPISSLAWPAVTIFSRRLGLRLARPVAYGNHR
jgi:hypothetical protein